MTDCEPDLTDVDEVPKVGGLYFLYDASGRLIYIGKAQKSIQYRLNMHADNFNFFNEKLKPYLPKINELPSKVRSIICNSCCYMSPIDMKWDTVANFKVILISDKEELKKREKELIKKYLPCYNFESNSKEYWNARKCFEPDESVILNDLAEKMM